MTIGALFAVFALSMVAQSTSGRSPLRLTTWVDMAKAHAAQGAQLQPQNQLPILAGTFTTFDIPGATLLSPEGINPRGDIVGGYYDSNSIWQNFVLSNGTVRNINPRALPHLVGPAAGWRPKTGSTREETSWAAIAAAAVTAKHSVFCCAEAQYQRQSA